jgi:hypothetical protein
MQLPAVAELTERRIDMGTQRGQFFRRGGIEIRADLGPGGEQGPVFEQHHRRCGERVVIEQVWIPLGRS